MQKFSFSLRKTNSLKILVLIMALSTLVVCSGGSKSSGQCKSQCLGVFLGAIILLGPPPCNPNATVTNQGGNTFLDPNCQARLSSRDNFVNLLIRQQSECSKNC